MHYEGGGAYYVPARGRVRGWGSRVIMCIYTSFTHNHGQSNLFLPSCGRAMHTCKGQLHLEHSHAHPSVFTPVCDLINFPINNKAFINWPRVIESRYIVATFVYTSTFKKTILKNTQDQPVSLVFKTLKCYKSVISPYSKNGAMCHYCSSVLDVYT